MTPYVAGVVKRLTRRIVAPLCVGSSPTTRPIFFYLKTGNEGPRPADSFIWGYRQAVRQRTLTPLSVVRLHLPLPVIKSCSFPLQDFLRGNKSLSRPVASTPFDDWRHHLPAPLGSDAQRTHFEGAERRTKYSESSAVGIAIECHIAALPRTPFCHYVAFPLKGKQEI